MQAWVFGRFPDACTDICVETPCPLPHGCPLLLSKPGWPLACVGVTGAPAVDLSPWQSGEEMVEAVNGGVETEDASLAFLVEGGPCCVGRPAGHREGGLGRLPASTGFPRDSLSKHRESPFPCHLHHHCQWE